jgi:hypothetical protein
LRPRRDGVLMKPLSKSRRRSPAASVSCASGPVERPIPACVPGSGHHDRFSRSAARRPCPSKRFRPVALRPPVSQGVPLPPRVASRFTRSVIMQTSPWQRPEHKDPSRSSPFPTGLGPQRSCTESVPEPPETTPCRPEGLWRWVPSAWRRGTLTALSHSHSEACPQRRLSRWRRVATGGVACSGAYGGAYSKEQSRVAMVSSGPSEIFRDATVRPHHGGRALNRRRGPNGCTGGPVIRSRLLA